MIRPSPIEPDRLDISLLQFCLDIVCPTMEDFGMQAQPMRLPRGSTAFPHGILLVVVNRANPEMRRVQARRVIPVWAIVQDMEAGGNRPMHQTPAHTVRPLFLAFSTPQSDRNIDATIATAVTSLPGPAAGDTGTTMDTDGNVRPE